METRVLVLPLALPDEDTRMQSAFLSRQLPVLLRNAFERRAPGRVVASPLATESVGKREWVVHREAWDDEEARRFAAERRFSHVALGVLDCSGGATMRELSFRVLASEDPEFLASTEVTGDVFRLSLATAAALLEAVDIGEADLAALLSFGTRSTEAFESYLHGLDVLLAMRSPGMATPAVESLLQPFARALDHDPAFGDALTAGLALALQLTEEKARDWAVEPTMAVLEGWTGVFPADPRVYAVQAEILIARDAFRRAYEVLDRGLLMVEPDSRDLLRRSADVLVEMGRHGAALERYRRCQALEPELVVVDRIASLAIMLGRFDEAREALRELVAHEPLGRNHWVRLALVEHRAGRRGEAWRCFAHLFDDTVEPAETDLLKLNTVLSQDSAPDSFRDRLRAWYPPESFDSERRLLLGRALRLTGARLEAGLCLRSLPIEALRRESRLTLMRERLNLQRDSFEAEFARAAHEVVNESNPADPEVLEFAIEHEPEFWPAWFLLGLLRSRGGDPAGAVEHLDRVIALNPENDVAWYTRGLQLVRLERDADAVESFGAAVRRNDREADYHSNLALAWARLGRAEDARAALRRVAALRPDHPDNERIARSVDRSLGAPPA